MVGHKRDPEDIILEILDIVGSEMDKKELFIETDPHKIQKYFYDLKKSMPEELSNIFFNSDPDYPYSPDIEQAFLNLQDYGFLTRPNPSLKRFLFKKSTNKDIKVPEKWKEAVKKFKDILVLENNSIPNGC